MMVKVCGNKYAEDFPLLDDLPLDYIGLIFHEASPRNVTTLNLPSTYTSKIGVFVNQSQAFIEEKVAQYQLQGVQLHGDESPEFCKIFKQQGLVVIKAFRVDELFDFKEVNQYEGCIDYALFDTKGKTYGGVGQKFDWSLLKNYQADIPYFISGGITAEDAEDIKNIDDPRLIGVDINSKFEIEPGKKDLKKVEQFIQTLHGTV